jgi:3-methylfumaryl-CoA hydratase
MVDDGFSAWIGRSELAEDVAGAAPLAGLAATLDHSEPPWRPGEAPPLGHWLYFLPRAPARDISEDGHPHRGGFLPPVPLPRRMWAGGEFSFTSPILVGETITRRSTIAEVTPKSGRSGEMVFVKVVHDIATPRGPALTEIHHIVYREPPRPDAPPPAVETPPDGARWERRVTPDIVLLFRFSALTFNGHRIHYDRDYCRMVEGYPGLVVHGPLTATLLMDLFLRHHPGAAVSRFRFRATLPLFDIHPFTIHGKDRPGGAELWALDHEGRLAMSASLDAI